MKYLKIGLLIVVLVAINAFTKENTTNSDGSKVKVTFIELGSVKCIPCQKMQGVIKKVEENYPNRVKTIFYDVWTKEQKKYAEQYKINLIPTQVFLDQNGKEYYRHEGYFPYEELEKILKQKL